MKTTTTTYTYDPSARSLTIFTDGKPRGGFVGPEAERRFNQLLESGADIAITNMNTEGTKKHLIRAFHACLAKQGIIQYKEDILSRYGVEHTTELTIDQLRELVDEFSTDRNRESQASPEVRRLRSDLLTLLNRMGIFARNNDWKPVNDFCLKHTGKMLYQMNEQELRKARKQFNSIYDWMQKKDNDIKRQALLN